MEPVILSACALARLLSRTLAEVPITAWPSLVLENQTGRSLTSVREQSHRPRVISLKLRINPHPIFRRDFLVPRSAARKHLGQVIDQVRPKMQKQLFEGVKWPTDSLQILENVAEPN